MNKTDKSMRGEFRSYLVSLVVFGLSVFLLIRIYIGIDPLLMGIWDSRYASYIIEYRALAGMVWRMLHRCTSSWLFILLPVMWALSAYLIQSGLKKEKAKKFNIIHTVLIVISFLIILFQLFRCMLGPL